MKRNIFARRAASAALAACMMFTLSAPALAASTDALFQQSAAAKSAVSVLDAENDMMAEPAQQMKLSDGSITVYIGDDGKQYAKQGEGEAQQIGNLAITTNNSETNYTLTIKGGSVAAKVTLENVNINASGAAVSVSGDVELNIVGTNTLHSGYDHAGLEKANDGGTLTISGPGELNAYGSENGAGIGGAKNVGVSNIIIEGGTINAYGDITGEGWGAGIGGGNAGSASNITINGGTVTATGGSEAAGIGGGIGGSASNITITDGDVTAIGGGNAAGIGGGRNYQGFGGSGSDITITGGTVRATGNGKAAAIGGGIDGLGTNITITGGDVTVKSSSGTYIGGTNGELTIDTSKLFGTITKLDGNGDTVGEVVQVFNIKINYKDVTSKNYKDILGNGRLWYDIENNVIKSNGQLNGTVIDAPGVDVDLNGGDSIAVTNNKLTVLAAHDVMVSSNKFAALGEGADINCTGKVTINALGSYSNYAIGAKSGTGDLKIQGASEVEINALQYKQVIGGEANITCSGPVTIRGKAETGNKIAEKIIFTQADGKDYVYYTSEGADAKPIDPRIHPLAEAAENSYLRIEPQENIYSIEVVNGTAQVDDDTTGLTTAFEGEKVTVRADAPTEEEAAEGVKFHHWKVAEGSATFALTEGTLGSEKEAGTEEISFDMPKGNVKLTAVYSHPASVTKNTVTVTGGTAKSALGEGEEIYAKAGETVEITATPYDAEKYPGMIFVEWKIEYPDSFYENFPDGIPEKLQLNLDNAKSETTTFVMPIYPVKLVAQWSASPVAEPDPDESFDEGFAVAPTPMDTTGGAIAAVAVGGAAILGGYEITTRVILHNILPEGAAIPANRGQLALLVWNTAGRPEPAGTPAFVDVADPDMAKAAQWCTEQGILDAKGDRFEPEGWTPKFRVIEVWNKAFPKQ